MRKIGKDKESVGSKSPNLPIGFPNSGLLTPTLGIFQWPGWPWLLAFFTAQRMTFGRYPIQHNPPAGKDQHMPEAKLDTNGQDV